MANNKASSNGHASPFAWAASSKTVPPPEPEPEAKPLASKPVRSLTPRGQRFSKLSDAYFNITSRQVSHNSVRKASDQSHESIATSSPVAPPSSPVTGPRLVKSQDDLQTTRSASAVPSSMKANRRASFSSIDCLEDLVPNMGRGDSTRHSLSQKIDSELLNLKAQPHDNTSSTIEGILAQYDARTPSLKVEHDNTQEVNLTHEKILHSEIDVADDVLVACESELSLLTTPTRLASRTSTFNQKAHFSPAPERE